MPRVPRLHVDGAFYHVILRGNHRQDIFHSPHDRTRFSELVADVMTRFRMRVHAYCWMTNHIHMAVQVSDVPLGKAMMRIARRYAWERQRGRRGGHFFERRYRALLVDADSYLLELIRYIHLNPVRAGMVSDPAAYPYSGHCAYLGVATVPWLTTDFALSLLSGELNRARAAYSLFVRAGIGITGENWLTGHPEEPRILGDDQFLSRLSIRVRSRSRRTLAELIDEVCREHSIFMAELAGPSRVRLHAKVRAVILDRALRLRIASLSEVARQFNRSSTALSRSLQHYRAESPEAFGSTQIN